MASSIRMKKEIRSLPAYPYRIYAAPRLDSGYYGPSNEHWLFVDGFASEAVCRAFWQESIVRSTRKRSGLLYEYVMCTFSTTRDWRFVTERRYADEVLITGTYERISADGMAAGPAQLPDNCTAVSIKTK